MTIDDLKTNLQPAMHSIDTLCKGFSVEVKPPYQKILDKVCSDIKARKQYYENLKRVVFLIKKSQAVLALEGSLAKQFKNKFIEIAKKSMIPEIRKFCKIHPEVDIEEFRPLFEIKIESK